MTGFSPRAGRLGAREGRDTHLKRFSYLVLLLVVALMIMIVGLTVLDFLVDELPFS